MTVSPLDELIRERIAALTGRTVAGFVYTDKRLRPGVSWESLPIRDEEFAQASALAGVDGGDALEPVDKEQTFDLWRQSRHFGEFLNWHAAAAEAQDFKDAFKPLLAKLVGEASLLVVQDRPVATYRRNGALNKTLLRKEQPQIVAKYTKRKTVEVFDEEEFALKEPMMFAAYRARRLCLVTSGGARPTLPS